MMIWSAGVNFFRRVDFQLRQNILKDTVLYKVLLEHIIFYAKVPKEG
jgi:hypothetical protein